MLSSCRKPILVIRTSLIYRPDYHLRNHHLNLAVQILQIRLARTSKECELLFIEPWASSAKSPERAHGFLRMAAHTFARARRGALSVSTRPMKTEAKARVKTIPPSLREAMRRHKGRGQVLIPAPDPKPSQVQSPTQKQRARVLRQAALVSTESYSATSTIQHAVWIQQAQSSPKRTLGQGPPPPLAVNQHTAELRQAKKADASLDERPSKPRPRALLLAKACPRMALPVVPPRAWAATVSPPSRAFSTSSGSDSDDPWADRVAPKLSKLATQSEIDSNAVAAASSAAASAQRPPTKPALRRAGYSGQLFTYRTGGEAGGFSKACASSGQARCSEDDTCLWSQPLCFSRSLPTSAPQQTTSKPMPTSAGVPAERQTADKVQSATPTNNKSPKGTKRVRPTAAKTQT